MHSMRTLVRVPGAGRFGKSLAVAIGALPGLPALLDLILVNGLRADLATWILAGWCAFFLVAPWRAGIWIGADSIVLRGWFRTVEVERGSGGRFDTEPYWGFGALARDRWLKMVNYRGGTDRFPTRTFHFTIGPRRGVTRIALLLNEALDSVAT